MPEIDIFVFGILFVIVKGKGFDEFFGECLAFFFIFGVEFCASTRYEMAFENGAIYFFEKAYCGIDLLGNIDAVAFFFEHFVDEIDLSLDLFDTCLNFCVVLWSHRESC